MAASTHLGYRADIDGLRAVAVLSVVVFHFFPEYLPGGFIGVDIFFVISGFLITSIIYTDLQSNKFSFISFYARRILRIFPALILVLLICFLYGWFILLPNEYAVLGKHILGGALFSSNIVLWNESGYFDNTAIMKPLLHLWSLGIEEQFYIFWPLLIYFICKFRVDIILVIFLLFTLSFGLNIYLVKHDTIAAFYFPLARFWELLVGAGVAVIQKNDLQLYSRSSLEKFKILSYNFNYITDNSIFKNHIIIWPLLSASLLLAGLIFIKQDFTYPSYWALFPVVGSCIILFTEEKSFVNNNFLSQKILVFIGLISYPLYLWHWPFVSYLKIAEGTNVSNLDKIIAIMLSILLAWITYYFVERPIRNGKEQKNKAFILISLMFFMASIGGWSYFFGFNRDFARSAEILDQYVEFKPYPKPIGQHLEKQYGFLALGNNVEQKVVVFGDSHAEQYINSFDAIIQNNKMNISNPPQILFAITHGKSLMDLGDVFISIQNDQSIGKVIFSYYWALQYRSDKVNYSIRCCGDGPSGSVGNHIPNPFSVQEIEQLNNVLENSIKSLINAGKKVYIVLDNPFGEEFAPQLMFKKRSLLQGIQLSLCPVPSSVALERTVPARNYLEGISRKTGAVLIDPFEFLCDATMCRTITDEGVPINKDYDHLSFYSSKYLVRYFDFILPTK